MGILRSIESSLERVVEGSFGRLFRASVQPVELARKLAKELEEGKVVSVSQTYAPNEYTVYLSRKDRERFVEYEASLRSELASYLAEQARRAGYVLPTRPRVRFETSTALAVGIFGISTAVVQEEASEAYERSLGGVEEQAPAPAVPPPPLAEERAPATVTSLPGMPPPIAPPPAPVLEVVADPEPVLPPAVLPLGPYDAVSGLDDVPPLEPEDAEDGPSEADEPVPAAALGLAPELPSEPEAVDEDPEEAAPGLELAPICRPTRSRSQSLSRRSVPRTRSPSRSSSFPSQSRIVPRDLHRSCRCRSHRPLTRACRHPSHPCPRT